MIDMRLRLRLEQSLLMRNMQAFLRVIREGESSQDDDAYRMMFGGDLMESMAGHPRKVVTRMLGGKSLSSSAAGAYQFVQRTWDECATALGLVDFGHDAQDLAAVYLIHRRCAFDDVLDGRLEAAIKKCNLEWASLPGSPYGQPLMTLAHAREIFKLYGGAIESTATTPVQPAKTLEATTMPFPAFLAAALPALIEAVPKLGKIFSSGSETAERNIQAAEMVVGIAKDAIGAKNEQELVETIKADPGAAQTVRDAIDANWGRIDEVGGGIKAAREANVTQSSLDPRRNMALWVTAMLLPLVYLTVCAVLFTGDWTSETKAMVVAAVISGVLGAITGYWLGTSFSSARKDEQRHGAVSP